MNDRIDMQLNRLLAEMAEAPPPEPGEAFLARVMADAAREQPGAAARDVLPGLPRGARVLRPVPGRSAGWIGALAEVFGGRGALAGMMLATVAGLFLGVTQPALLTPLYSEAPLDSLDLLSGSDNLWTEVAQ